MAPIRFSLDIPFQNLEQFPQFSPGIACLLCAFNAVMEVGMDQFFRKGFQGFSRGDELHQNIRAVLVVPDHGVDGVQLPRDAVNPIAERLALFFGMRAVVVHGQIKRKRDTY